MSTSELYQEIYDKEGWYGNASIDRCPGMRLLPKYKDYISGKVVELGCGRGSVTEYLQNNGFECEGYDQVKVNPNMNVADITDTSLTISGDTVICIDVIEHILDEQLEGLYENFKKFNKQIFSIHNGPSPHNGVELHINIKPFEEWDKIIEEKGLQIEKKITIHKEQVLYITKTK